jgi:predicted metal-dependent hydrolase
MLFEVNHGPAFIRLLVSLLPDWRQRKERLEQAELT